jgi:hypothetical protein
VVGSRCHDASQVRTWYGGDEESLPDLPITTEYLSTDQVPAFFGHDWLKGVPTLSSDYAACLDFSVAKAGYLTAYRWSGEKVLSTDNIVYENSVQSLIVG